MVLYLLQRVKNIKSWLHGSQLQLKSGFIADKNPFRRFLQSGLVEIWFQIRRFCTQETVKHIVRTFSSFQKIHFFAICALIAQNLRQEMIKQSLLIYRNGCYASATVAV